MNDWVTTASKYQNICQRLCQSSNMLIMKSQLWNHNYEIMSERRRGSSGDYEEETCGGNWAGRLPERWWTVPVLAKESMDSVCTAVICTSFVLLVPSKPMSCWHLKDWHKTKLRAQRKAIVQWGRLRSSWSVWRQLSYCSAHHSAVRTCNNSF